MKKETIDLIKSITEKGFLVIVDPGKLKGDGAVMIEAINLKDGAIDEKINDEIAKLAGFKKEDPKPEIDMMQCDGRRFRAKIEGVECEGKIRVDKDICYGVYLCNDQKDNARRYVNKFEYRCAWFMRTDTSDFNTSITNFELLPEPRVIFINCVGEVFTEEDDENDIIVWYYEDGSFNKIYACKISSLDQRKYKAGSISTDIFRSKKSLLKYLYETCE